MRHPQLQARQRPLLAPSDPVGQLSALLHRLVRKPHREPLRVAFYADEQEWLLDFPSGQLRGGWRSQVASSAVDIDTEVELADEAVRDLAEGRVPAPGRVRVRGSDAAGAARVLRLLEASVAAPLR